LTDSCATTAPAKQESASTMAANLGRDETVMIGFVFIKSG